MTDLQAEPGVGHSPPESPSPEEPGSSQEESSTSQVKHQDEEGQVSGLSTQDHHQTSKRPPDIEPKGNKHTQRPVVISNSSLSLAPTQLPPVEENFMKECEECHQEFLRSYLWRNFAVQVCDDCRDPKEAHELITRTDAKAKYLLKDCDLDARQPALRYILKKNPYQSRGDMRLYLKFQVEERALEVHKSEEHLEEELERREERRQVKKQKTYDKKMKSLSMSVRSSLYKRDTKAHEHEFGEAVCLDEDEDLYRRVCKTCGYEWEYEEM